MDQNYLDPAAESAFNEFDIDWWVKSTAANEKIPGMIQLFVIFVAESAEPGHLSRNFMKERDARLRSVIVTALPRRQAAGELAPGVDVTVLATSMIGVVDGIRLIWLNDRDLPLSLSL